MSLLQMSFFGAVLIIVIAAIRAVTINRLPKKTFLILWGIVLFRLLIPYSVPSVLSVYTWANTKTPVIEKGINRVPTEDTKNEVENVYTHNPSNGISIVMKETSYGQAEQTGEVPQQPVNSISHISITLIIWVAGMVLGVLFHKLLSVLAFCVSNLPADSECFCGAVAKNTFENAPCFG